MSVDTPQSRTIRAAWGSLNRRLWSRIVPLNEKGETVAG